MNTNKLFLFTNLLLFASQLNCSQASSQLRLIGNGTSFWINVFDDHTKQQVDVVTQLTPVQQSREIPPSTFLQLRNYLTVSKWKAQEQNQVYAYDLRMTEQHLDLKAMYNCLHEGNTFPDLNRSILLISGCSSVQVLPLWSAWIERLADSGWQPRTGYCHTFTSYLLCCSKTDEELLKGLVEKLDTHIHSQDRSDFRRACSKKLSRQLSTVRLPWDTDDPELQPLVVNDKRN